MIENKTLIVTLGGQAQVVTFALDWLLAQGEQIDQVVVPHLSPQDSRIRHALDLLANEFCGRHYITNQRALPWRPHMLGNEHGPLLDIRDESAAEATWQSMYALVADLKAQGQILHLCVAGGRRIMGLMAMSAAMLLFDHRDRLWHLYTPDELRKRAYEGAIMHVNPDEGVRLIQVPISPWGAYFPGLRTLAGLSSSGIVAKQQAWLASEDEARCRRVRDILSERQREVLQAFASGLMPQQVAEQLSISLKTVDSHKTVILDLCRNEWLVSPGTRLDYHFLRDKFRMLQS